MIMNYGRRKKVGFSRKDIFFKYEVDPRYITSKKPAYNFLYPSNIFTGFRRGKTEKYSHVSYFITRYSQFLIHKTTRFGQMIIYQDLSLFKSFFVNFNVYGSF